MVVQSGFGLQIVANFDFHWDFKNNIGWRNHSYMLIMLHLFNV